LEKYYPGVIGFGGDIHKRRDTSPCRISDSTPCIRGKKIKYKKIKIQDL